MPYVNISNSSSLLLSLSLSFTRTAFCTTLHNRGIDLLFAYKLLNLWFWLFSSFFYCCWQMKYKPTRKRWHRWTLAKRAVFCTTVELKSIGYSYAKWKMCYALHIVLYSYFFRLDHSHQFFFRVTICKKYTMSESARVFYATNFLILRRVNHL